MKEISILQLLIVMAVMQVIALGFLYVGFWMGRQTVDKPFIKTEKQPKPLKDMGQPALNDYDPFQEALNQVDYPETINDPGVKRRP